MVINGLGFVGRPLYLTPEFYANKPVDLLIGEGIEAADLNEDSVGKALDYGYEAGITELFASVSAHALRQFGIQVRFAHLDTTAFSLEGAYEPVKISLEFPRMIRLKIPRSNVRSENGQANSLSELSCRAGQARPLSGASRAGGNSGRGY
jgi:hypothetical protein